MDAARDMIGVYEWNIYIQLLIWLEYISGINRCSWRYDWSIWMDYTVVAGI